MSSTTTSGRAASRPVTTARAAGYRCASRTTTISGRPAEAASAASMTAPSRRRPGWPGRAAAAAGTQAPAPTARCPRRCSPARQLEDGRVGQRPGGGHPDGPARRGEPDAGRSARLSAPCAKSPAGLPGQPAAQPGDALLGLLQPLRPAGRWPAPQPARHGRPGSRPGPRPGPGRAGRAGRHRADRRLGQPYVSRTARISSASEMITPVKPSSPRSRPVCAAADSVAGSSPVSSAPAGARA